MVSANVTVDDFYNKIVNTHDSKYDRYYLLKGKLIRHTECDSYYTATHLGHLLGIENQNNDLMWALTELTVNSKNILDKMTKMDAE